MRIGAPVFGYASPSEWVKLHIDRGYNAAYCPVSENDDSKTVSEYLKAAKDNDIVIAEVGVWNNLLDPDLGARERNIQYAIKRLELAEKVGARCCVNISGSISSRWDGPHPDNISEKTFDMVVRTTQRIIDAVKPDSTYYSLEPMPWMYPHNTEDLKNLISAIDRRAFAVHADMCNLVNSFEKVYHTGDMTREYFLAFGSQIRSVHAKDTYLRPDKLTMCIEEAIPGEGVFDYDALLIECAKLNDVPVMSEHLANDAEYVKATSFIRARAKQLNLL